MRELTGNWYLKKRLFGYVIMVEVKKRIEDYFPDRSEGPDYVVWEKARNSDIFHLKIPII